MSKRRSRQLTVEGLEFRKCFSIDVGLAEPRFEALVEIIRHNSTIPTDVNQDGITSPVDALNVINELNQILPSTTPGMVLMSDTNDDGLISPVDALLVINRLNVEPTSQVSAEDIVPEDLSAQDLDANDLLKQLGIDLDSLISGATDQNAQDSDWPDLGLQDLVSSLTGHLDVGDVDETLLGQLGKSTVVVGDTYDPTDDNGNNFFLADESALNLIASIEAELRSQLQLDESASIEVAVYNTRGEVESGTWRYLTAEGVSIWGNWRKSSDELRLFLSNVEEENRIYGQYPDGSFLYFSWLGQGPVGFYFTPLNTDGVENPVPTALYTQYFQQVGGDVSRFDATQTISAVFGNLGAFAGVQPIESLISDLYAIQRRWDAESDANAS